MSKVKPLPAAKRAAGSPATKRGHDVRPHRLHMLLSDDEAAMLDRIAKKMGLTRSDAVRQILRKAAA